MVSMSKANAAPARATRASRASRNMRNGLSPMQLKLLSFLREARWVLFAFIAAWLALVLATWSPTDPGWSHSSNPSELKNQGGILGAYAADILLYLFGFSAWLLVLGLLHRVRAGWRRLIHQVTQDGSEGLERVHWEQAVGFVLLLIGSVGLESLRLSSLGTDLPGQTAGLSGS